VSTASYRFHRKFRLNAEGTHRRASIPSFALSHESDCTFANDEDADPFIIDVKDLRIEEGPEAILGSGNYGVVRRGALLTLDTDEVVAVKTLPIGKEHTVSMQNDLMVEIETIRILTTEGGHQNIIKLIGYVPQESPVMVTEFAAFGSLDKFLKKKRKAKPPVKLGERTTVKFACQIADGMAYMVSKKVIHRDLASRNVLVGEDAHDGSEQCKITDFGLARDTYASPDGTVRV
jgi:serine/threonine protein kinase